MNQSSKIKNFLIILAVGMFFLGVGLWLSGTFLQDGQSNDSGAGNNAPDEPNDSAEQPADDDPIANGMMNQPITNFEQCQKAGYPVMESYPRQCRADGETFVEELPDSAQKDDLIRLTNPLPNQSISSPLTVEGEARGTWFFEGDFPVVLTNWDGLIIATGIAQAQGEWMTGDFVPFKATLEFEKPSYKDNGSLILQRNNPSDLPEQDDALEIPILFE